MMLLVLKEILNVLLNLKKLLLEMVHKKEKEISKDLIMEQRFHRNIIGAKGARIVFPIENDDDKKKCNYHHRKEEVETVELNNLIAQLKDTLETTTEIDPKHHRYFVTRYAEVLKQISGDYGDVIVSFPKTGSNNNKVALKGAKDFSEPVKQRLRSICWKINTVHKRGSMLAEMIKNKDKRKNWHFEILANNTKSKNVFEKVSRPSKRQNVLNALFIRNISDVMSTGDIIPEIIGSGIEITGVKVSPCCKLLQVFWQVPTNDSTSTEDLATLLNLNAHKIRAELISRNVMGRVPQIFFTRDITNAHIAAFEKAMEEVESELKNCSSVVPDDTFVSKKKLFFKFTDSKEVKGKEVTVKVSHDASEETKTPPPRPSDMKLDVFGLNHDNLMNKVNASRNKNTGSVQSHVILLPEWDEKGDLFNKIPGTSIHSESNREAILKQFLVKRKKLMYDKKKNQKNVNETLLCESLVNEVEQEPKTVDEDYIEEDTEERF
ncbi:vigilin [Nephila pilipes]|uniref:Vigilin n=1 Tax=Nephila pilipes TaxID=299642 RepID=A0A8X6N8S6_NEPPI|nr:vigilin [Nephila pilipes]